MSRNLFDAIRSHVYITADVVKGVVARPLGGGFWLAFRHGCKQGFKVRGQGSNNYAPGMSVDLGADHGGPNKSIITLPPMGRNGASASPYNVMDPGIYDGIVIRRAVPDYVTRGANGYEISLIGRNFLASPVDSCEAVVYNAGTDTWDTDPDVTVTGVTFISSTEIKITINVSNTFPMMPGDVEGTRKLNFKVYRT